MTSLSEWDTSDIPPQSGRLAVVTGATQGIGHEVACALAAAGADVVIAARSPERAQEAASRIRRIHAGASIRVEPLDLAQLSSVAGFASTLRSLERPVDILVNNAAVMAPPARRETADGFELQFQVNYLAHFTLTACLLPLLAGSSAGRVVHVTSLMYHLGHIDFADLQSARRYRPARVYAQSKLAALLFAQELQRRSDGAGWGITSVGAHPGISFTNLAANSRGHQDGLARLNRWVGSRLAQSAAAGALPTLFAATSSDATPGGFYGPGRLFGLRGPVSRARIGANARSLDDASRLWTLSEQLTGVSFPPSTRQAGARRGR